jgi:phosphate:Na+ symporter
MLLGAIGGLGIFLLGMRHMSEGIQAIAGDRLRALIHSITSNRFQAIGVGTLVTCLIQSSSITTVMVVGFVNSGFMTLTQAIGVIMGANIGTTITGWILVVQLGKYGLPILGVAALVFLFAKKERWRYLGMAVMGIGMIFFGLELMTTSFKPLREVEEFRRWFALFTADSYFGVLKCAAVGCLLTCIVQSSSATLGITMGLAATGVIGFPTAAALVLGENIGTTITAWLASLGASANAKRAALSHAIFNVLGVAWATAIFPLYLGLIGTILGGDPGVMVVVDGVETFPRILRGIALIHTIFNVANTILFIPLLPMLARFVTRLVPEPPSPEKPHLSWLDGALLATPVLGIGLSYDHVVAMGAGVRRMVEHLRTLLEEDAIDADLEKRLFAREEILDAMQHEVVDYLTKLLSGRVPNEVTVEGHKQLRVADELESISDALLLIYRMNRKLLRKESPLSPEARGEVMALHERCGAYIELVCRAFEAHNRDVLPAARLMSREIGGLIKADRERHFGRLTAAGAITLESTVFPDALNAFRAIRDHCENIAEVVAEAK